MIHKNRLSPRAIVHFPAGIEEKPSVVSELNAMVVDVSLTGARVQLSTDKKLPKKLFLSLQYLSDIAPITIEATCVWKRKLLMGLHFKELSSKNAHILHSLIAIHRAELKKNF